MSAKKSLAARKAKKSRSKKSSAKKPRRHEGQALLLRAITINDASNQAQKKLERDLHIDALNTNEKITYAVKSRVKSPSDILQKVDRKRRGSKLGSKNWHYEPYHLTDGCGFRIVTVFQDGIPTAVRHVIDMITHKRETTAFVKDAVKEITIYSNRHKEHDEIAQRVKRLVDESGLTFQDPDGNLSAKIKDPEHKKSGYSSTHIVAYVAVEVSTADGRREVRQHPVEIQVRDIFEEGWGEIDHALRYVNNRETGNLDESDELYQIWQPHLTALKTFADGCSQHATLIKRNAIDIQKFRPNPDETLPSDSAGEIASELQTLLPEEYSSEITQVISQLRYVRDTAEGVTNETHESTSNRFLDLSERLGSLCDIEMSNGKTVRYRLGMEAAFCLDISVATQRVKAIEIYNDVLSEYRNDVFPNFRISRAFRNDGKLDLALEHIKVAEKNIDNDSSIDGRSFVRAAIPRNAGYIHWVRAEHAIDSDDPKRALEELANAVKFTVEAKRRAQHVDDSGIERLKAANNTAYFVLRACEVSSNPKTKIQGFSLLDALNALESEIDECPFTDVFALDTAFLCYDYARDSLRKRRIAKKIVMHLHDMACAKAKRKVDFDQVADYLKADVRDIGLRAYEYISPGKQP